MTAASMSFCTAKQRRWMIARAPFQRVTAVSHPTPLEPRSALA
jgi:hypothetical protein